MNLLAIVALYSAAWLIIHFGSGYVAHRLSVAALARLPFVTRSYAWEASGRVYERLAIRSWKDHLPEAGNFYAGGFSKRCLQSNDAPYLKRFLLETSRAELSHWLTWGMALTFFAWTPWNVAVAMLIYGALVNLPCILIQRYNRGRLWRAVRALARRTNRNGAALPADAVAH